MQHQSDSRIGGKGSDVGIPIPFCRLMLQNLLFIGCPIIAEHPQGHILVNICLILCSIESQPNTTILPEFCHIPLLLVDDAARLELGLGHCRLQFIFLDNLPPVENQGVDNVGKYVVEGLQLLLCNFAIPSPPSAPLLYHNRGNLGRAVPKDNYSRTHQYSRDGLNTHQDDQKTSPPHFFVSTMTVQLHFICCIDILM